MIKTNISFKIDPNPLQEIKHSIELKEHTNTASFIRTAIDRHIADIKRKREIKIEVEHVEKARETLEAIRKELESEEISQFMKIFSFKKRIDVIDQIIDDFLKS